MILSIVNVLFFRESFILKNEEIDEFLVNLRFLDCLRDVCGFSGFVKIDIWF